VRHYCFSDKFELITYCVRQYKAECVTRYDSIVADAGSADELKRATRTRPPRWKKPCRESLSC
jgi:hypothetical protein